VKDNPVYLLGYIMKLNSDAHNMMVLPPTGNSRIHLKVEPGRRPEVYNTTQNADGYAIATVPAAALKKLEQRAIGMDLMTETNRVNYENARQRGVNRDAHRFCIAYGHPDELIQHRHDNHLCYMCGDNVRASGTLLHTFWDCPKKLGNDDRVQKILQDQARDEGDNVPQNTQHQSNVRRAAKDGSARQEAEHDTSYGRPSQRGQGQTRWGARESARETRDKVGPTIATPHGRTQAQGGTRSRGGVTSGGATRATARNGATTS
jgi:hypothetical protein